MARLVISSSLPDVMTDGSSDGDSGRQNSTTLRCESSDWPCEVALGEKRNTQRAMASKSQASAAGCREFAMVRSTHMTSPAMTMTTAHKVLSRPMNTVPKVNTVVHRYISKTARMWE